LKFHKLKNVLRVVSIPISSLVVAAQTKKELYISRQSLLPHLKCT